MPDLLSIAVAAAAVVCREVRNTSSVWALELSWTWSYDQLDTPGWWPVIVAPQLIALPNWRDARSRVDA